MAFLVHARKVMIQLRAATRQIGYYRKSATAKFDDSEDDDKGRRSAFHSIYVPEITRKITKILLFIGVTIINHRAAHNLK